MMTPLAYEDEALSTENFTEADHSSLAATGKISSTDLLLFAEKLAVPASEDMFQRPRIVELLSRSLNQFNGTMISGRVRTGKTTAAADVARRYGRVGWYSIEATDIDWQLFSKYFCSAVRSMLDTKTDFPMAPGTVSEETISAFLNDVLQTDKTSADPRLLVLDDIHHVFDAPWFSDLFKHLLFSVGADIHLLFTCRSKPPLPLWRLRSKQLLNVIDEKVLVFDASETEAFLRARGHRSALAKAAQKHSFGRIGKIVDYVAAAAD
ncbi:MAG: hypothetical protein JO053_07695 [Acidobacteria bacterium]|nr:hypothetical protein [Acidobacteriota bacterium]